MQYLYFIILVIEEEEEFSKEKTLTTKKKPNAIVIFLKKRGINQNPNTYASSPAPSATYSYRMFHHTLCLEGVNRFNSTTTTRIPSTVIVRGNRFLSEWKEKMDYGRCGRGLQSIMKTIPTCHIPINFGLITFQLNQCILTTEYSTIATLCDHTID